MSLCNCCFDHKNIIINCKNKSCVYKMCNNCHTEWYYSNNKSKCPHCQILNVKHLKNTNINNHFIGNIITLILLIEMLSFTLLLICSIILSLEKFKNDLIKLFLIILFSTLTTLVLKILKILNSNPILYNYIIPFF